MGLFPFFLQALIAPTAEAFPDLIRKGYQSCVFCHVSPTGGGALTGYGRGVSEELATFQLYEGSGQFAGIPAMEHISDMTGLFQSVKVDLQADYRSVAYKSSADDRVETIQMERVGHAAFHVGKTTDLVASYGLYGNDGSAESREHYIQVRTSKYLSLRWGRFFPAYGINFDDHTLWSRSILGVSQGHEIFGLEAFYDDDNITVTLTRVLGESVDIVDRNRELSFNGQNQTGYMGRAGIKFGARHIAGVSFADNASRYMFGGWVQTAPIRDLFYILADINQQTFRAIRERNLVGTVRIGSELVQGLTASLDTEFEDKRSRFGFSVQSIPIPHVELRAQARRENESGLWTAMLMGHLWL
jgi:hypothetical protein